MLATDLGRSQDSGPPVVSGVRSCHNRTYRDTHYFKTCGSQPSWQGGTTPVFRTLRGGKVRAPPKDPLDQGSSRRKRSAATTARRTARLNPKLAPIAIPPSSQELGMPHWWPAQVRRPPMTMSPIAPQAAERSFSGLPLIGSSVERPQLVVGVHILTNRAYARVKM